MAIMSGLTLETADLRDRWWDAFTRVMATPGRLVGVDGEPLQASEAADLAVRAYRERCAPPVDPRACPDCGVIDCLVKHISNEDIDALFGDGSGQRSAEPRRTLGATIPEAMRDRHEAGEPVESLAHDFGWSEADVRAVCAPEPSDAPGFGCDGLECPSCGAESLFGYMLRNESGAHMHTRYVCTRWPSNSEAHCGWSGWTVPDDATREPTPSSGPRASEGLRAVVLQVIRDLHALAPGKASQLRDALEDDAQRPRVDVEALRALAEEMMAWADKIEGTRPETARSQRMDALRIYEALGDTPSESAKQPSPNISQNPTPPSGDTPSSPTAEPDGPTLRGLLENHGLVEPSGGTGLRAAVATSKGDAPSKPRKMPSPDDMHGACDSFGGEDAY